MNPALLPLLSVFVAEGEELAGTATRAILALEAGKVHGPDDEAPRDILGRVFHTMKGAAGTLGMNELATLAHAMEDALPPRTATTISSAVADVLLQAIDLFLVHLRAASDPKRPRPDLAPVMDALAGGARTPPQVDEGPPPMAQDAAARRPDELVAVMREVERLRELRSRLHLRGCRAEEDELADIVLRLEEELRALASEPVGKSLEPLQRVVRDLAARLGKEVTLSIIGGDLSIDRRVLAGARDALLQLVRNAVDHGIEPPEDREARGKHRAGLVIVRVEHEGNSLFLEVSDDGWGLDVETIRRVAVERGLMTPEAASASHEKDLLETIFHPGFSTRVEITESSGRGFGMHVVKESVERLRGHIELESRPGQGTRFIITVPLELGSTPLLLVRVDEQIFALPLRAVDRVVTATRENLRLRPGAPELVLDAGPARLVDLRMLLGLSARWVPSPGEQILVLRDRSGARLAVRVDEIAGDQELALRPMPREAGAGETYVGVSTDPDGGLALVIRPEWLFKVAATAAWGAS